jgi:hypothetical protein
MIEFALEIRLSWGVDLKENKSVRVDCDWNEATPKIGQVDQLTFCEEDDDPIGVRCAIKVVLNRFLVSFRILEGRWEGCSR